MLATQKDACNSIKDEIQTLEPKIDPDYILKDPYILEFLDLKENKRYQEKDIEQGLIDNMQEFLLELGKGFSLVAWQKRITIDGMSMDIDIIRLRLPRFYTW